MPDPNRKREQKARETIDGTLAEPDVLAEEIIENLEAGLDGFRQVLAGLSSSRRAA